MRIAKVAAVAILFLLIPHQEPFAGPAGDGGAASGERAAEAAAPPARPESADREALLWDEGFVWSLATGAPAETAWTPDAGHLETDGYSWSLENL